jgi:hypothetical protein
MNDCIHAWIRSTAITAALAASAAGCALETAPDAPFDDGRVHRHVQHLKSGAELDVEVRFAGGFTRAEAEAVLARVEVLPARELFPQLDPSRLPVDYEAPEPLAEDEPTFEVVLLPLNDAALAERFAWRTLDEPRAARSPAQDGVAASAQALSLDATIAKQLDPGETWRTARLRCYAPFGFGAEIVGGANVCIDLGYEGKAGSVCSAAFDPREPVLLAHPGPNLNPFDKHYFRGRVTAKLWGIPMPALIAAAGYACL